MSFEAYRVAVRLSLVNGVSTGLIAMMGQFRSLDKAIANPQKRLTDLEVTMARIRKQALIGGAALGVGIFGLDMISKTLKPAEEYTHQLNVLNMSMNNQRELVEAVGAAWKNTGTVITTTATENLRTILDLKNVLGDIKEAQMALPIVSRIQAVLAASSEGQISGHSKELAYSMAKALDIIGAAQDPATFERQAEMMAKVIVATQGRVTPEAFKSVFQYARQARYQLSDEFKYQILPSLIQENSSTGGSGGGSRGVGPMLAALYRWTNQGYINKKALPELQKLGWVNPGTALRTTTEGTTVGPMIEAGLASSNPFLWVQHRVADLKRVYGENITKDQMLTIINSVTRGNQLASSLFSEFAFKPVNFLRDQKIIQDSMGTADAYKAAISNDPNTAHKALGAQWENFKTALGMGLIPVLVPTLMNLAQGFNTLATVLRRHPTLTKDLVIGFTALAGAMAFGGTLMLLSAGFKGLRIAMAFTGLGLNIVKMAVFGLGRALLFNPIGLTIAAIAAAAYLLWRNWDSIGPKLKAAWDSIKGAFGALADWFRQKWEWIKAYLPAGWFGDSPTPVNTVQPRSDTTVQVKTQVNLDGRKVADVVTEHQSREASRPYAGASGFDPSMGLAPVGLGYAP